MATYQEQIEKLRLAREAREALEKTEAEEKARQLSPDQIAHWRLVLANMGIPFAMSMPDQMVQRFRNGIQAKINAEFPSFAANSSPSEEKS